VTFYLGCHVSIDRVKIGLGAKTTTYAKPIDGFVVFFLRTRIAIKALI